MNPNIWLLLGDWEKNGDKPHAANVAIVPNPDNPERCSVWQDGVAVLWVKQGEDWVVLGWEVKR